MYKSKLIVLVLVTALLAGCSAGEQPAQPIQTDPPIHLPYEIVCDNGEYYLLLESGIAKGDETEGSFSERGTYIEFGSMNEMIQDIKTGNFTEDEMRKLSKFRKDEDGRTILCNLSRLYEAYTPEQFDNKLVRWFGEHYRFDFDEFDTRYETIMVKGFPGGNRDVAIADIIDCTDKPNFALLATEQVEDRNATMITYASGVKGHIEERKSVYYTIEDGGKDVFVYEEYDFVSAEVPSLVVMFGIENGVNYSVYLAFVPERPSVEYLLGFGFREYVETEVA